MAAGAFIWLCGRAEDTRGRGAVLEREHVKTKENLFL